MKLYKLYFKSHICIICKIYMFLFKRMDNDYDEIIYKIFICSIYIYNQTDPIFSFNEQNYSHEQKIIHFYITYV